MEKTHGYYIPTPKEPQEMNAEELEKHLRDVQPETIMKALKIKAELKAQKHKERLQRQKQHDIQLKLQNTPQDIFIHKFGLSEKNTNEVKQMMREWSTETLRAIRDVVVNKQTVPTYRSGKIVPFSWDDWSEGRQKFAIQYLNYMISQEEHKKEIEKSPLERVKEFVNLSRGH